MIPFSGDEGWYCVPSGLERRVSGAPSWFLISITAKSVFSGIVNVLKISFSIFALFC
jgi:hypothetical protein